MPTLTIRNVPAKVVEVLKASAKRNNKSMEQEVRELLESRYIERRDLLDVIDAERKQMTRRPTAEEIDAWIEIGRP